MTDDQHSENDCTEVTFKLTKKQVKSLSLLRCPPGTSPVCVKVSDDPFMVSCTCQPSKSAIA